MPFTSLNVGGPVVPYAYTVPTTTANGAYTLNQTLQAGVYNITPSGGTLSVEFWNASGYIGGVSAITALTQFNLAQQATRVVAWNATASTTFTLELKFSPLAPIAGVVRTFTTSQGLNLKGLAYVLLMGASGGGGGGDSPFSYTGQNGGPGGWVEGRINLVGGEQLTIGQGGLGGPANTMNANGQNGGNTTLGSLTATGGIGGLSSDNSGSAHQYSGQTAAGGTGTGGVYSGNGAVAGAWPFFPVSAAPNGGAGGTSAASGAPGANGSAVIITAS